MKGRLAAIAAISTIVVSGVPSACSVSDEGQPDIISGSRPAAQPSAVSRPATPSSAQIELYFVSNGNRVVARIRRNPTVDLSAAIKMLLAGPTGQESAVGISSAIPVGTVLDSVHQFGTTAVLDFSTPLASVYGHEQLLAFAQIVLTADSLPQVDQVRISIAGQQVNAPEPNGTLAQGAVTANDYSSLVGSGTGRSAPSSTLAP